MNFVNVQTLEFNRLCVLYAEMGKLNELVAIFTFRGIFDDLGAPLQSARLAAHAEELVIEWDARQAGRACYSCSQPQPGGRLCTCFFGALISTHNLPEVLATMGDRTLYTTYVCTTCKNIKPIYGKTVKNTMFPKDPARKTWPVYRLLRVCLDCQEPKGATLNKPKQPKIRPEMRGLPRVVTQTPVQAAPESVEVLQQEVLSQATVVTQQ